MAFRRFRRRRFRGGGGNIVRQRPTWRRAFDFSLYADSGDTPTASCHTNPNDAAFVPFAVQSTVSANRVFMSTSAIGSPAAGPGASSVFGQSDMAFFEGSCSMIRLMGWLRLHVVTVDDQAAPTVGNQVEVRAWIFKTTEEDVSNRVAIVHPFFEEDFDSRILWAAHWLSLIESEPVTGDLPKRAERHLDDATATNFFNQPNVVSSESSRVRRISIRQAVRLKGNERISVAVGIGPLPAAGQPGGNNDYRLRFSGMARMLVKH